MINAKAGTVVSSCSLMGPRFRVTASKGPNNGETARMWEWDCIEHNHFHVDTPKRWILIHMRSLWALIKLVWSEAKVWSLCSSLNSCLRLVSPFAIGCFSFNLPSWSAQLLPSLPPWCEGKSLHFLQLGWFFLLYPSSYWWLRDEMEI